jgi:hypothetical protein
MLDAGADLSLENSYVGGYSLSSFEHAIEARSVVSIVHPSKFHIALNNRYQSALEQMINLGDPFISPKSTIKPYGREIPPLIFFAFRSGGGRANEIQTVDKAIFLLKRKADISCRDYNGDTVLHALLKSLRDYERPEPVEEKSIYLSLTQPKQLLMVFMTAGADVCAINDKGETPSTIAQKYGKEDEWTEALTLCGYDPEVVFAQSNSALHDPPRIPLTPKLSFEQFCQNRQEHLEYKKICFGEYCQECGERFRHEMISFEECCPQCGEEFQARKVSFGGHYQTWREKYLLERASCRRYYEEWLASLPPKEDKDTTNTDDESDEDGYTEISDDDEYSEDMNICMRPTNHDTEPTQEDDWNGENLEGSGCDVRDIDIDLEEAEVVWNKDPIEDVGDQGVEHGDCEGVGFTGSSLNTYGLSPSDMDIFKEFCNFSNGSDEF